MATEDDEIAAFLREEVALRSPKPAVPASAPVPAVTAAARGFGQGATLNFSDELGAAIDTGISKIPGVRDVAQKVNELGGGSPGLSPLTNPDLSYAQRRDEYRARNAETVAQRPLSYAAGAVGGGITASPLLGPGASASTPARLAVSTAEGVAAGSGANEKPDNVTRDLVTGGAIGLGAGAVGAAAQKYIAGAPAREEARTLNKLGVTPKVAGRAKAVGGQIESNSDDVIAMLKRNADIKAAARAGDPKRVVEVNRGVMAPKVAETRQIYQSANAAKGGGMDPVAARQALNASLDQAIKNGAPKAYVNRMKAAIDQVEALEVGIPWQTPGGSGVNKVIPADKLRDFITDKLAPTGQEKLTSAAEAVRDAALALKGQLYKFAGKDAARLQALDKEVSTHIIIEEAALKAFDKARYTPPGPGPGVIAGAKSAVGAAADKVAAVGGGRPTAAIESGTRRAAVSGVIDKIAAEDHEGARRDLVQEIYGAP